MDFVVRFPVFNHIIFGGIPLTTFKSTKSASNVTIVKLFDFAYSKISKSEES